MPPPNPNTLPPRKRLRSLSPRPSFPNGPPADHDDSFQYELQEDEQLLDVEEDEDVEEEVVVEEVVIEEEVEIEAEEDDEDEDEDEDDGSKRDDADTAAKDEEAEEEEEEEEEASGPEGSDGDEDERRRKRRRLDYSVEVCRDFTKKCCFRSEIDCKFAHPHSYVAIEGDRVTACADSLRGACFRGRTCKYYHPPPHIQQQLREANGISEQLGRTVCKDFLRGRCSRGRDCRFSHSIMDERVVVCQDFLRGKCERKTCKYSHLSLHEADRLQRRGSSEKFGGSSIRRRDERKPTPICSDFLNNKCFRDYCKYLHPKLRKESTVRVDSRRETCRDFLRGACRRKDCRFYHPHRSR